MLHLLSLIFSAWVVRQLWRSGLRNIPVLAIFGLLAYMFAPALTHWLFADLSQALQGVPQVENWRSYAALIAVGFFATVGVISYLSFAKQRSAVARRFPGPGASRKRRIDHEEDQ